MAERPDMRAGCDLDTRAEHHVGFYRHVRGQFGVGAQEHRAGISHRDPGIHRGRAQPRLHRRLGGREFAARIDAGELVGRRFHCDDATAIGVRQCHDIGEVVFALGIVGAHLAQPAHHV